jgi:hypothetical protein
VTKTEAMNACAGLVAAAVAFAPGTLFAQGAGREAAAAGGLDLGLIVLQAVGAWLAAAFAWLSSRRFETGAPARRCWIILALAFLAFAVAETIEVSYTILLGIADPFPSVADIFFFAGYAFSVGAFMWFVRVYKASGLDTKPSLFARVPPVLFAILGALTLLPMHRDVGSPLESALTTSYVVADIIVLFPAFTLLDATRRFRGGRIWPVWASLLFGFTLFCAGDLLFAYFEARGRAEVDRPADILYLVGYWAMALGTFLQHRLLKA